MWKFVLRRLLLIIPIVFGVVFIVFTIMNITPSDPGRAILGLNASQEAVDKFNEEIGYNRPFFTKFFDYIVGIITRFDFGTSYSTNKTVINEISINFPVTFKLVIISSILNACIGISIGVYSAVKQYSLADNILRVTAMIMAAVPEFWVAMLAILLFALKLKWLPSNGIDSWKGWVIPIAITTLTQAAPLIRLTRTILLETIRQDYIRTVRAKGAPEKIVIWRHAFRNSLLPVINNVGIRFAGSLGGMVVMEQMFSMPGLGNLSLKAIYAKDLPVVMGCTLFLSSIFCLMMLVIDIISAYCDPRVKAKYEN